MYDVKEVSEIDRLVQHECGEKIRVFGIVMDLKIN
jgi:hypothetical protein